MKLVGMFVLLSLFLFLNLGNAPPCDQNCCPRLLQLPCAFLLHLVSCSHMVPTDGFQASPHSAKLGSNTGASTEMSASGGQVLCWTPRIPPGTRQIQPCSPSPFPPHPPHTRAQGLVQETVRQSCTLGCWRLPDSNSGSCWQSEEGPTTS